MDHKINLQVFPPKTNIDHNIIDFITSLSYDGFILAGDSVANIIENVNITNSLDFWVLDKTKYLTILTEFSKKNPRVYDIYPSMVEMVFVKLPAVNLILSDTTIDNLILNFDFDYCRCYYSNQTGFMASEVCLTSIFTKSINHVISYNNINPHRILQAIKYKYYFNRNFWNHFNYLLKKPLDCLICHVTSNDNSKCMHFNNTSVLIITDHINMDNINFDEINIEITSELNIHSTINELKTIFKESQGSQQPPKLLTFLPKKFYLVRIYCRRIILLNPVLNSNCLNTKFKLKLPRKKDHNNKKNINRVLSSSNEEIYNDNSESSVDCPIGKNITSVLCSSNEEIYSDNSESSEDCHNGKNIIKVLSSSNEEIYSDNSDPV